MDATPGIVTYDLEDLKFTATAALFEGKARAGIDTPSKSSVLSR